MISGVDEARRDYVYRSYMSILFLSRANFHYHLEILVHLNLGWTHSQKEKKVEKETRCRQYLTVLVVRAPPRLSQNGLVGHDLIFTQSIEAGSTKRNNQRARRPFYTNKWHPLAPTLWEGNSKVVRSQGGLLTTALPQAFLAHQQCLAHFDVTPKLHKRPSGPLLFFSLGRPPQ